MASASPAKEYAASLITPTSYILTFIFFQPFAPSEGDDAEPELLYGTKVINLTSIACATATHVN
jgi:hypothetical protein